MSFFAPPPTVTAEVFARLPDRFRHARPSAWANANRGGHPIDSFLEGPVFDRAGRLDVTDIPFGRVYRLRPSGELTCLVDTIPSPNGIVIDNSMKTACSSP